MSDNGQAMFANDNTRFGPVANNEPVANDYDADDATAGVQTADPFSETPQPDPRNQFAATPADIEKGQDQ